MACFYNNVLIESADLIASDNFRVYFDYYDCTTGLSATTSFDIAGSYPNAICNNDTSGSVTYYILVSGIEQFPPNGSNATPTLTACDITPTPTETETPTPTPTQTSFLTPTPTPSLSPSSAPFIATGYLGTTTDIACSGSLSGVSVIFTANTNDFCTATSLTGNTFASQTSGNYYLASNGQIIQISLTQFINVVSVISFGCTNCPTPTPTITPTLTETPTPTVTPTITGSQVIPGVVGQFIDCDNGSIFRFAGPLQSLIQGSVYLITGSTEFEGCATFTADTNTGPLFNANGVTFIEIVDCADTVCPRVGLRAALLLKCGSGIVIYGLIDEDTAFLGATYIYNGECYYFEEFSGPGGPYFEGPISDNCDTCAPQPTPAVSPTPTPTVPIFYTCENFIYCLDTTYIGLSGLSGNYYWHGGYYNCYPYYEGGGSEYGIIFHTGVHWCLSTYLGGPCIIRGAYPCLSTCPDLDENVFTLGPCPTPTVPPVDCDILDFLAYFDCKITPTPTIDNSLACDVVGFSFTDVITTPTPTVSPQYCANVGISFSLSSYTPSIDTTPTPTPTITPTNPVLFSGSATFEVIQNQFTCASVKVLLDESTGIEYYTSDSLIYNGTPIVIGITIAAVINGVNLCVTYVRDDSNYSSNSTVESIFNIYGTYSACSIVPSPTVTTTITPTPSITPTITMTPSITPSISLTPSITPTITLTPTLTQTPFLTPSITPTMPLTQTPTPSITPTFTNTPTITRTQETFVHVYESCQPLQFVPYLSTQVIQTQKVDGVGLLNTFRDSALNCWTYLGTFSSSYVAPINVVGVIWQGNYFATIGSTIYSNCSECINGIPTTTSQITINNDGVATGQPDFCGGYSKSETTLKVTNFDSDGLQSITETDIVVEISLEVNDCIGVNYETIFITIPSGTSFATQKFTSFNLEECPLDLNCTAVTKTVYSVVSITPSTVTKSPSSQY